MKPLVSLPSRYNYAGSGEKFIPLPDWPLPVSEYNEGLSTTIEKVAVKPGRKANGNDMVESFCRLYATRGDLPASQCAALSGYAVSSAKVVACRLLKKPEVQHRIQQIIESGVPCVVRKTLKERQSLWSNEFAALRQLKYNELRAGLGDSYKEYLDNRYNKVLYNRHQRKEGHMTHRLHMRIATEYAMNICNARYGQLSRRKQKWDKYNQKWVW